VYNPTTPLAGKKSRKRATDNTDKRIGVRAVDRRVSRKAAKTLRKAGRKEGRKSRREILFFLSSLLPFFLIGFSSFAAFAPLRETLRCLRVIRG
jgi:hypothetical protein